MTRREAIIEAAIDLFAQMGYDATPTARVAAHAGVAQGTVFRHFATKEALLGEILVQVLDEHFATAKKRTAKAPSGLDAVEAMVRSYFGFMAHQSSKLRVVLRDFPLHLLTPGSPGHEQIVPRLLRLIDLFKECLERGKRDGSIRDVPVEETVHILRGMLYGLCRLSLLGPLQVPDLEDATVAFCRRSLQKGT